MDKQFSISTADYADYLSSLEEDSVDLILTDPPYAISKKTGFVGTGLPKLWVNTEFGEWDQKEISLNQFCGLAFRCLRKGGTLIVFYDLWKLSRLAGAMKDARFKQLRFLEWIKDNPVPLNAKRNYLTNAREIAVSAVKVGKPVFNSEYDNGVYRHPIPSGKDRFHPTQKPLMLFHELIEKHSEEGALVVDPFLGSGTTAVAAVMSGRRFAGCDKDEKYVKAAEKRVEENLL